MAALPCEPVFRFFRVRVQLADNLVRRHVFQRIVAFFRIGGFRFAFYDLHRVFPVLERKKLGVCGKCLKKSCGGQQKQDQCMFDFSSGSRTHTIPPLVLSSVKDSILTGLR